MIKKKLLMTGNEAMAAGAIAAGCRFYAGYPITPQNELIGYMAKHMPESGGVFIQAESELAAINMVFGASAAGARAMTSSSSPGISLKQEGISYLAGAQLPAVIVNVMRGGPGLGNIAPAQADYFQATRCGGHGDYRQIVLAPASVQEAYDFMFLAFSLADKYRTPTMVLGDGMLGQMMEPLKVASHPSASLRTGKSPFGSAQGRQVTSKKWALSGCKGRAPNVVKSFCMREGELEQLNLLLQKKYQLIRDKEQRCETLFLDGAKVVLVAYGTMARIAGAAVRKLRQRGKRIGLIRPITLWPFPEKAFQRFLPAGRQGAISDKRLVFLAVEMSSGQMVEDVRLAVNGKAPVNFFGRSGGGIPNEEEIINRIKILDKS